MSLLDEVIDYIVSSRELRLAWYLLVAAMGAIAVATAAAYPEIARTALGRMLLNAINEIRQEFGTVNVDSYYALALIFSHNAAVDVVDYSLLALLVTPAIYAVINGLLVGLVVVYMLPVHGSALVEFYLLAPHGVIEVPAFALVGASVALIRKGLGQVYYVGLKLLVLSLILLAIAATIESSITPLAGYLVRRVLEALGVVG